MSYDFPDDETPEEQLSGIEHILRHELPNEIEQHIKTMHESIESQIKSQASVNFAYIDNNLKWCNATLVILMVGVSLILGHLFGWIWGVIYFLVWILVGRYAI
jgi:hypothetical protein